MTARRETKDTFRTSYKGIGGSEEVNAWKEKWVQEFTDHGILRRQYAAAQDIITQYIQVHSKLCYRCKAKDKLTKITL